MRVEFDPAKNERNIRERGLSFERAAEFDFESAITTEDTRREYGESAFDPRGSSGRNFMHSSLPFEVRRRESSACEKLAAEKGRFVKKSPNPEMIDADNPEWTKEDFARAVPFSQLPESFQEKLRLLKKPRGPQKAPTKELISIRLSRDVVERLRASGRGWQARVDAHLRKWVRSDPALGVKSAKRQ